ncbi:MAG: tRNA (N(6)-L-threonylcarbamoyladenosine(37)-C(2))-methylthiotransferase MtaB [Muribaculaceae bacterium]|nr:tRNA (N(6)-L-threonylcarbamoyladenosine(37)-C(2))-methylthiotransferase MtaB [Bacteroidales bacterium]MDY4811516.1 tRNA (N(6)-L-threonylcarbamoyladenosine(37)-C(2))-methylthiotransferase MtaB [Muribaculaceae bacterium]
MPTALYHTFGCKLNFAETSSVARRMADMGIRRAEKGEVPDLIFVNTCSVTELADKKCRQTIRSYNRRYPEASIVVTGCYAQLKSAEVAALPGVALVIGNDRKGEIDSFVARFLDDRRKECSVIPARDIRSFSPSCSRGDRTRYFLKVQDGCDCWCTYCTIPAARGRSRSGTVAQLVEQVRRVADEGGREVVITGVNIGDFGRRQPDAPEGAPRETFLDLIRALDAVEGIDRYRISSIEPDLLTDESIEFCAKSRAFMPHFHIPLQCGSDEVLRLMRRRYDTALFRRKIERIVELMPDAFIGVDLIVGARGETDELFEESVRFVQSLPITRLHIFPYSERPGTRALEIPYVVDPQEKHRRMERMTRLSDEKFETFARRYLGTVRPVLLEHSRPGQPMAGFTDNYLRVKVADAPASLDNCIANVRLDRIVSTEANEVVLGGTLVNNG